jgi:hypothetical protein
MSGEQVHVHAAVLQGLLETAEAAGGLQLAQVVGAAAWAFSRQDEILQEGLVQEYCLRGPATAARTKTRTTIKEQIHELVCHLCAPFRKRVAR